MLQHLVFLGLMMSCGSLTASPRPAPALPQLFKDMMEAPLWPLSIPDPTGRVVLYLERAPVVTLDFLAAPAFGLAGTQIDSRLWAAKRRSITTNPSLFHLSHRQSTPITGLRNRPVEQVLFSPDGQRIAMTVDAEKGVEVWIADTDTGKARMVDKMFVNDSFVQGPLQWFADSGAVIVATRPRFTEQLKNRELEGPTIEEAQGSKVQARTYPYLLRSAEDQILFRHVAEVQLVTVDARSLKTKKIGPAMSLHSFSLAPDGKHILLQSYAEPYSLAVPANLFARDIQVLDQLTGQLQKVLSMPLAETVPPEGERTGPRDIRWQLDHPARLLWWEALDDGDPRKKVPHRDRLMSWDLPFSGVAVERFKLEERAEGLSFMPEADQLVVRDMNPDTNRIHVDLLDLNKSTSTRLLDYDSTDVYRHPGNFIQAPDRDGRSRLVMAGELLFLEGSGKNPKGEQPFVDSFDLKTKQKTRIFQSAADAYYVEEFSFMLNRSPATFALQRQAADSPPNLWALDLATQKREELTHFRDNVPAMTKAEKKPLVYQRQDGLTLSGTLYLPEHYEPGTKLPAVVWAYPEEFRTKDAAGQVRVTDKRYSRPSPIGIEWLVTQGYAVLYNAAMPVIGDKETVNNTFVQQIVANAEAAINAMDKLGIVDRQRIAIGGHSYGAFMTANLLAHSQLFCAGISRSGAYNRSLTPFGFQSERRTFWEARDFYMLVSPFAEADKIKTPLLLIHGKNDNNPGTLPMQSERMFQAIRGVGGVARLVLLPYESHAYRARENVQLVQSESLDWLNRYCGPKKSPGNEKL